MFCFLASLLVHRVERNPFFGPGATVSSILSAACFFDSVAYTCSLNSNTRSQFSVEVASDDVEALSDLMTFWIMSWAFFDVMVSINVVVHVHAQQSDRLLVDRGRRCNGTLADELRAVYSVSEFLVYNDRNSMFAIVFSSAHDNVSLIRLRKLFFF